MRNGDIVGIAARYVVVGIVTGQAVVVITARQVVNVPLVIGARVVLQAVLLVVEGVVACCDRGVVVVETTCIVFKFVGGRRIRWVQRDLRSVGVLLLVCLISGLVGPAALLISCGLLDLLFSLPSRLLSNLLPHLELDRLSARSLNPGLDLIGVSIKILFQLSLPMMHFGTYLGL